MDYINITMSDNFSDILNYTEEKLLIFSILTIDFISDIVIRYYIDNTFNVNTLLISLYILYKLQQISLFLEKSRSEDKKTYENKLHNIIANLDYENSMLLNQKENLYKKLLEQNNKSFQQDYPVDKNLVEKIKNIIDSESRSAKKVTLISSLLNANVAINKNKKMVLVN